MLKKIGKIAGAVFLALVLAVLAYMFTPLLALMVVSMQSVTAVLLELVILLAFLALVKVLLQVLIGKKIQLDSLKRLTTKFPKMKQKATEK